MTRWLPAMVLAALPVCSWAQAADPAWGSSLAALSGSRLQPLKTVEIDGEIVAETDSRWGERPARLLYVFAAGKLVRSKYIFTAEHTEPAEFLSDYATIAIRMLKDFGKPIRERAVWENDSLQEERIAYLEQDRALPSDILPSDKGSGPGIALGHVKLYAQWCGPQTEILHTLTGKDGKVTHQIEFRSVEWKALESGEKACVPPVL